MINFKRIFVLTFFIYMSINHKSKAQYVPTWMIGRYMPQSMSDEALHKAKIGNKLYTVNWADLDHYGRQMDRPLMIQNVGALTDLYAAMAPKRSFVGVIDAGFYREPNGKLKYRDDAAIGAIAL